MNHHTRKDLNDLLGNIAAMQKAFSVFNYTTEEDAKRAAFLSFCEALGAVEGQAFVVKTDLDVHEAVIPSHSDPIGMVSTVERHYVPKKRCSADPCQKQVVGNEWFCEEHLQESEHA